MSYEVGDLDRGGASCSAGAVLSILLFWACSSVSAFCTRQLLDEFLAGVSLGSLLVVVVLVLRHVYEWYGFHFKV
ncbi:transmembrane protein, putative [Medicago truncatula]|nr:transmembrane protein, putative [Medicago truncatula]